MRENTWQKLHCALSAYVLIRISIQVVEPKIVDNFFKIERCSYIHAPFIIGLRHSCTLPSDYTEALNATAKIKSEMSGAEFVTAIIIGVFYQTEFVSL